MRDLVDFLEARFTEDELAALRVAAAYTDEDNFWAPAVVVKAGALVNPSRVLDEVAVKRAILEQYRLALRQKNWPACTALEAVLPLLARPYAKHPAYRHVWEW